MTIQLYNYTIMEKIMSESKNKIAINFRIETQVVKKLKKIAREKSFKENQDITYIDLIKTAINDKYL